MDSRAIEQSPPSRCDSLVGRGLRHHPAKAILATECRSALLSPTRRGVAVGATLRRHEATLHGALGTNVLHRRLLVRLRDDDGPRELVGRHSSPQLRLLQAGHRVDVDAGKDGVKLYPKNMVCCPVNLPRAGQCVPDCRIPNQQCPTQRPTCDLEATLQALDSLDTDA